MKPDRATQAPLPPERSGYPAPEDLRAIRERSLSRPSNWPARTDVRIDDARVGDVPALTIRPSGAPRGTVLHLHGGGFRMGSPRSSLGLASMLAAETGVQVVVPAYRLAPEHPFPAGLSDALRALRTIHDREEGPLLLSGDSAGGGLAAGLTRLALAEGMPVEGLLLLAPWLDLTVSSASYDENSACDELFSRKSASAAASAYLQGHPATDPLASPLFGMLTGYPSTCIIASEHEVLRDDSISFARALSAAGGEVTLKLIAGMQHVAITRDPELAGASEGAILAVSFIRERLAAHGRSAIPV